MSSSALCRCRPYIVRVNVAFGFTSFVSMSFVLMSFELILHVNVVRVNVVRVNVAFGLMSFGFLLFGLMWFVLLSVYHIAHTHGGSLLALLSAEDHSFNEVERGFTLS